MTGAQVTVAQNPEAEARQLLMDSLQAHGGADGAARARQIVLTGTVRSRVAGGGFAERSFRIHAGGRGAFRAEFSADGFTRVYVSDGELARVSQNGKRKGLKLSISANRLFPFFPLNGLFAALTGNELRPLRRDDSTDVLAAEFAYLDARPHIPRSRSLRRRYRVGVDPESLLVSSMTLFSSYGERFVPEEPAEIVEYTDYRLVDGIPAPFSVRVLLPGGFLESEYLVDLVEFVLDDPDLSLP